VPNLAVFLPDLISSSLLQVTMQTLWMKS